MEGTAGDRGEIVVGVLSDTHGHLYPAVRELLQGVDHIIHAGDVGSSQVLMGLKAIAPLTAVRGNCDLETWAQSLPAEAEVELGGVNIFVSHVAARSRGALQNGPGRPAHRVVIAGHTHRAESEERDGTLYLNPGSAGPERFGRARTLARLFITPDGNAARVDVQFAVVPAG